MQGRAVRAAVLAAMVAAGGLSAGGGGAAGAQSATTGEAAAGAAPGVGVATGAAARGGDGEAAAAGAVRRGPVTNLPLPRFVSLKAAEGNARRGPGRTHSVDWVFTRRDMPLRVTAEYEHWRRVEDREGAGGWVHYSLLSGVRTGIVETHMTPLLAQPDPRAPVLAYAEAGVIVRLLRCRNGWCRIGAEGRRGWVPQSVLWGVAEGETID